MKEFFVAVWEAHSKVRMLKRRKAMYEDMAQSLGANLTGMPRSGTRSSKVERAACELAQLQSDLEDALAENIHLIHQAQQIIKQIPGARHRRLLELRYIDGLSWKDITVEMDYQDDRSVYKAHGVALLSAKSVAGGMEYHNNSMV